MPKKPGSKSSSPKVNKSAWIRAQPATTSAKDLVTQGKAAGIKLSVAQVYTVRANAKKTASRKGKVGRPAGKAGPRPRAAAAPIASESHDQHFVSLVLDLGLAKAEALLARVRERVKTL